MKNKFLWIFVAICVFVGLYLFLFYKKFDAKSIHKNADFVAIIDVKNCRNSIIFDWITHPKDWKYSVEKNKKTISFRNLGVEISDYLSVFHIENQPENLLYCKAKVNNEEQFAKSLTYFQFVSLTKQKNLEIYFSKTKGLFIFKKNDEILVSNANQSTENSALIIAKELLIDKMTFVEDLLLKNETDDKITFWLKKNSILQQNALIHLKINNSGIEVLGSLVLNKNYTKNEDYQLSKEAIFSLGSSTELIKKCLFSSKNNTKIDQFLGFSVDSILSKNSTNLECCLNDFVVKKDSAISYEYDDDFNKVEKITIQNRNEPSFLLSLKNKNSKKTYQYLENQKVINSDSVFVNFPFAKTIASCTKNYFTLKANHTNNFSTNKTQKGLLFINANFPKLLENFRNKISINNKIPEVFDGFSSLNLALIQNKNKADLYLKITYKKEKSFYEYFK